MRRRILIEEFPPLRNARDHIQWRRRGKEPQAYGYDSTASHCPSTIVDDTETSYTHMWMHLIAQHCANSSNVRPWVNRAATTVATLSTMMSFNFSCDGRT